jgi:pyruvate dehydrogenase E2 component (dihydrolipoamide acetyltransferase)
VQTDVARRAGIEVRGTPTPARARPAAAEGADAVPLTRVQQVIAARMEAAQAIPVFQVQTKVAMDDAVALRADLRAAAVDLPPSLNDLVVKAAALALRAHPRVNGSYADGSVLLHRRINVGVAVAGDDALLVPTITDADTRPLRSISDEIRKLAERVRARTITPDELAGGTFTVSNLGMYGMTAITPVINVPQAAILGVGALCRVLQLEDGIPVERTEMTLTLTCDHRILYGADAAHFLSDVRDLLESPLRLVHA